MLYELVLRTPLLTELLEETPLVPILPPITGVLVAVLLSEVFVVRSDFVESVVVVAVVPVVLVVAPPPAN